ncbi:ATP-dependent endonuclease [Deefgea sp. CFH1-16]|nr:TOPRIM nucleotidyl transferase/hydrolase domain-containing protein [Deefgea sp. CFH1-16]
MSDARKVAFHIRSNRASSMFARVWLLVEGETEFWLLPELARICGVNFPLEGIRCVEFAQAGLAPLIKFADHLGIHWHVICDGDDAGMKYQKRARSLLGNRPEEQHITMLNCRDIEHFLWDNGFADTYRQAAAPRGEMNHYYRAALEQQPPLNDEEIISRALRHHSKPGMALEIAEAAEIKGRQAVPAVLQNMFQTLQTLSEESS